MWREGIAQVLGCFDAMRHYEKQLPTTGLGDTDMDAVNVPMISPTTHTAVIWAFRNPQTRGSLWSATSRTGGVVGR
jgi:hypothetical protein